MFDRFPEGMEDHPAHDLPNQAQKKGIAKIPLPGKNPVVSEGQSHKLRSGYPEYY